ncbi:unnamed protein product, partial [Ectocarpus sp. 4 AP-2014]
LGCCWSTPVQCCPRRGGECKTSRNSKWLPFCCCCCCWSMYVGSRVVVASTYILKFQFFAVFCSLLVNVCWLESSGGESINTSCNNAICFALTVGLLDTA